jgi:hypothetical protein
MPKESKMDYEAIAQWALSGSTGASASAIVYNLAGVGAESGCYPHDSGDFERCERVLNAVPELRQMFGKMSEVNQYWAALVLRWDEIKGTPKERRYDLMQSILRPKEDGDKAIIRLGDGVSLRMGNY